MHNASFIFTKSCVWNSPLMLIKFIAIWLIQVEHNFLIKIQLVLQRFQIKKTSSIRLFISYTYKNTFFNNLLTIMILSIFFTFHWKMFFEWVLLLTYLFILQCYINWIVCLFFVTSKHINKKTYVPYTIKAYLLQRLSVKIHIFHKKCLSNERWFQISHIYNELNDDK